MIIPGMKLGRLTVQLFAGRANDGHGLWQCVCECGVSVTRQSNNLQAPGLKSCGCAARDVQVTHGMRGSPEYGSWQAAKKRCLNAADKDFPRYGGRGIRMCQQWLDSFEAFFEDMGSRPEGMSLERRDTNGDYEPGNCIWATPTEQARNRRRSVFIDWRGSRRHLSDVAAELSITYGAAFMRLKRGKLQ